jgi:hypothetical protein
MGGAPRVARSRALALVLFSLASSPAAAARWRPAEALSAAFGRAEETLTAASSSSSSSSSSPPTFCHGIDCPPFETVATSAAYDTRAYPAGLRWTSTVISGAGYDDAVSAGFGRLFRYISGANADGVKIAMTAPVRVRVDPGRGPFCDSNVTVSFFVPFVTGSNRTKQIRTPRPTDASVFEDVDEAASVVYARSFGGFADETRVAEEAAALEEALAKDGKGGGDDGGGAGTYFFAGYDSPFRVFGRHNEVWVRSDELRHPRKPRRVEGP